MNIEVGDIVEYEDIICIVVYDDEAYWCPLILISLKHGKIISYYETYGEINSDPNIKLRIKEEILILN